MAVAMGKDDYNVYEGQASILTDKLQLRSFIHARRLGHIRQQPVDIEVGGAFTRNKIKILSFGGGWVGGGPIHLLRAWVSYYMDA